MVRKILFSLCITLIGISAFSHLSLVTADARADEDKIGFLRYFVTLKANEANMRTGPSVRYPVKWVYNRKGYPLEVVDVFDHWRKVRDKDDETGWLHESLLSGRRSVVILKPVYLFYHPKQDAPKIAKIEPEVIVTVSSCKSGWCKIEVQDYEGWIPRQEVWGIYPDEIIED